MEDRAREEPKGEQRTESSVSAQTRHWYRHLGEETAESLGIKNGALLGTEKALDT